MIGYDTYDFSALPENLPVGRYLDDTHTYIHTDIYIYIYTSYKGLGW